MKAEETKCTSINYKLLVIPLKYAEWLKYLRITVTIQNYINEEVNSGLNSVSSESSTYLSCTYKPKTKIHKNLMLPPFYKNVKLSPQSWGCLRKKVLGMRRWRKLHNDELHNLYPLPSTAIGLDGQVMKYTWEIHTKFSSENLKWRKWKWPLETCKHRWEENRKMGLERN